MSILSSFYHGLAVIHKMKNKMTNRKDIYLKKTAKTVLTSLQTLACLSEQNDYHNKAHLMQAELCSVDTISATEKNLVKCGMKARDAYDKAIESSRVSSIVNEEGLCCELAGKHCERFNDKDAALKYFERAKKCYKDWGSQMKEECMDEMITRLKS